MSYAATQDIASTRAAWGLRSRAALLSFAAILGLAAVTRLPALWADPPWWMQGAFISDEGWWADSARGKVLFNDYFSDDFGTAYLITPGYTWVLEPIYRVLGVGTAQTRLPEALAALVIIAMVGGLLWRYAGHREALVGALLLTLSPFFWSYSRVGLQEMMQAMLITGSFTLWFLSRGSSWAAVSAGAAMAMAVVTKPNSIDLGLFPMTLATMAGWAAEAGRMEAAGHAALHRRWLRNIALAGLGTAAVLGLFYLVHARPNWAAFKAMALAESGAPEARLIQRIKFLGMFLISMEIRNGVNTPIVWNMARWSPALMIASWFCLLAVMMRLRAGWRHLLRGMDVLEAMTLAWALGIIADVGFSYYQPDRRYVLLAPALVLLVAVFLGRTLSAAVTFTQHGLSGRPGFIKSYCLWFVLTLPALVLLKPPLTAWIMKLFEHVQIGRDAGLDYSAAGTLFMAGWLPALAAASWWLPRPAEAAAVWILRRSVILLLPCGLMVFESAIIASGMIRPQDSMIRSQKELADVIRPGETVMGHVATTLLMGLPVRTVRRVSRFEYTPPPNPDIWDRLHPRYILEMTRRNYEPAPPLYPDLVARGKYQPLRTIEIGPRRYGRPRYVFELYEMKTQ